MDDPNTLPQLAANHVPLSPLSFLQRAARIYPKRVAIIHGARRTTYAQMAERSRRLASALRGAGIAPGDVVAVLAPNIPEMLEAHYGVPMAGAILLTINIRLDAAAIGFILQHSQAKLLLVDREYTGVAGVALAGMDAPPPVVDIVDTEAPAGPSARPDRLRGLPRRRRSAAAAAAARGRVGGDRALLYLGHHRQSEGCRHAPSWRLPECLRQRAGLRAEPAQRLSLDAADVPLQRLDLYLGRDAAGRHACLPAQRAAGGDLRRHRRARRDPYVRRPCRARPC